MSKRNNQRSKSPDFVQVFKYVVRTEAWRSLSGSAVKVYLALKGCFNGTNNGRIFASVRMIKAATALQSSTVTKALRELQEKGFVVMTKPGCLGVEGHGLAATWRLTELPTFGERPTRDFESWTKPPSEKPKRKPPIKIQKPVPKNENVVPTNGTGPSQ